MPFTVHLRLLLWIVTVYNTMWFSFIAKFHLFPGVYAEHDGVKKLLSEKYGKLSLSELKENKEFNEDLMEADVGMTVRLQIIYGKLSIRSVRSAFEESVGSRLQKFGGSDNKELLQK